MTAQKEIKSVLFGTALLCAVMLVVFACIGRLDRRALFGAVIGFAAAAGNFLLLALTIRSALGKQGARAGGLMGISYLLRLTMIGAAVIFAIRSPCVNYVAAVIPLVFPRFVITFIGMRQKRREREE